MDINKEALMSFYEKALTVNQETRPSRVLAEILAESYISYGSLEANDKTASINFLEYAWSLIPDMKVEPQEIINEGNQYAVRSVATGTPNGDFFGLQTDGTKSYRIMTIDIVTVEGGKLTKAYHLEDWSTAMVQLKA